VRTYTQACRILPSVYCVAQKIKARGHQPLIYSSPLIYRTERKSSRIVCRSRHVHGHKNVKMNRLCSLQTARGTYGKFERIQGVSVRRGKSPRSFSPCEPLLASHKTTRRRCWRQATHERKRLCAVARVHCWAAHHHFQCCCPNHCFPSPRLRQPPQPLLQTPAFVAHIQ